MRVDQAPAYLNAGVGVGVGVGVNIALGFNRLQLAKFEATPAGLCNTPHLHLGLGLSLLPVGRLIYKFAHSTSPRRVARKRLRCCCAAPLRWPSLARWQAVAPGTSGACYVGNGACVQRAWRRASTRNLMMCSVVLRAARHIEPRLCPRGAFANRRNAAWRCCGLRLATRENPSVF